MRPRYCQLSLWLGGGAPAAMGVATADIATCSVAVHHEQTLCEEEIADITLSTFHISDRERTPRLLPRIAAGACVACAASGDQPAYNGPASRMSPPPRKPTRPYVQTLKRPQERPQTPKHQDQNVSRTQREAGARTTNQNATRPAQPELDGLVVNQSAGQQAQPQIATPVTNSGN